MTLHQSMASSTEDQNQRGDPGGQVGESWAYLLPQTHQAFTYIYSNSLRMPSRLEQLFHRQSYKGKATSKRTGGVETQFLQDPYLQHNNTQEGGLSQPQRPSLRSKGFKPHIGHLHPEGPAPGNESLIENQWGLTLGELEGYRKPRLHSQKACAQTYLLWDIAKQQFEKHLGHTRMRFAD